MISDRYAPENNIVPIIRIEANFSLSLNSGPTIHRIQSPQIVAFACTMVQDFTLPSIVVSFNLNRQKKFNYGQLYVTFSRVKSLGSLYIEGQLTKEAVSEDLDVEIQDCRRKTQVCLMSQIAFGLSVALLNIRLLSNNILEIAGGPSFKMLMLLFMTEAQILYNQESELQNQLENHQLAIYY